MRNVHQKRYAAAFCRQVDHLATIVHGEVHELAGRSQQGDRAEAAVGKKVDEFEGSAQVDRMFLLAPGRHSSGDHALQRGGIRGWAAIHELMRSDADERLTRTGMVGKLISISAADEGKGGGRGPCREG